MQINYDKENILHAHIIVENYYHSRNEEDFYIIYAVFAMSIWCTWYIFRDVLSGFYQINYSWSVALCEGE